MPTPVEDPEVQALITEALQYADAEMKLHEEMSTQGRKLEDIHASNASLFAALADALESATPKVVEETTASREVAELMRNLDRWSEHGHSTVTIAYLRRRFAAFTPPQSPSTPTPNGENR